MKYPPSLLLVLLLLSACTPTNQADPPPTHQTNWVVFSTFIEGYPAVVSVDLGLKEVAPVPGYTQLVRVSLLARSVDDNGFPVDSELRQMISLEETLEAGARSRGAFLVGRTTSNAQRNLFFFSRDGKALEKLFHGMLGNSQYRFALRNDPDWDFYFNQLYPDDFEMNQIRNEQVLARAREAGDILTEPRPVDHFLYFPDRPSRDRMITIARREGFTVLDTLFNEEDPEEPFQLKLSRVDTATNARINEVTWRLQRLAREAGGMYDGWETELVRGGR